MIFENDLPWSAPWTERRGAADEAAFVADVSGALHVPDAPPEIRMFAEVMAILDIPSELESRPQPQTVASLLQLERGRRGATGARAHRFRAGRRMAGIAAAAGVAVGLFTVSAYAGVLPDSIQRVAHTVINAPAPHHDGPQRPAPAHPGTRVLQGGTNGVPAVGTPANAGGSSTSGTVAPAPTGEPAGASVVPALSAPTPQPTPAGRGSGRTDTSTPSPDHTHVHKSTQPGSTAAPNVRADPRSSTPPA